MHPERYTALTDLTEEVLIGERVVLLDQTFQDIFFGYSNEEVAEMLHIAAEAKRQCKAEAYDCKFIPPPRSVKGKASKDFIAVYLDEQHSFVLRARQDVDRIVKKELARRVDEAKETAGVSPAAWAAAQFLTWWRGQVAKQLETAERAVGQLFLADQAEGRLEFVEVALADLRASIASPRGPDEMGRTKR